MDGIGCDARGKVWLRKQLRRHQVLAWFARLKPCRVGMEACATAHYWGRELGKLGHEVKLIAARHVKAFVRGNKNDYNDALGIAEAVVRPEMRFVAIKSASVQDIQALYRLREQRIKERTALDDQIRGLLGEYGISIPKGKAAFKRRVVELLEEADSGLSERFRRLLRQAWRQYQELEAHLRAYDEELARVVRENEACRRLQTIPGFGPVIAGVFFSRIGSGEAFRRGREVSAALGAGATPTQQWWQGALAGHQQTRRQLPARALDPWRPSGGCTGGQQDRPSEPLGRCWWLDGATTRPWSPWSTKWRARRDSNPRPLASEANTLSS